MSNNGWTPERRKKQSEMIRSWRPWERSSGPKTEAGKEIVSMNAEKHGAYGRKFKTLKDFTAVRLIEGDFAR